MRRSALLAVLTALTVSLAGLSYSSFLLLFISGRVTEFPPPPTPLLDKALILAAVFGVTAIVIGFIQLRKSKSSTTVRLIAACEIALLPLALYVFWAAAVGVLFLISS